MLSVPQDELSTLTYARQERKANVLITCKDLKQKFRLKLDDAAENVVG